MKQQAIKEAFRDWIWKDPDRRRELVQLYNERFNSTRPREYDGRHLIFPGMNPEITLREHQRNAIAHDLYGDERLCEQVAATVPTTADALIAALVADVRAFAGEAEQHDDMTMVVVRYRANGAGTDGTA